MNESGAKQQIVDNIRNTDTILVTVSKNPTVDELSAALGVTMYLNELGKHATAVVSGALPPAINFLEPEKTFEPTVDSLRDFVIALDKEKADHLRYKVEGDVVKIFITPYKTVITSKDLEYSQGDYNVEMILAFGVTDQDHLDSALEAHGKILHDATVATIGVTPSTLGTIDWCDETSSSLSELAAGLTEALQDAEKPITSQIASALLTGVVAATDRFSNEKTTARTMSVSAQLMAAGANQQLIASKLREGNKLPLQQEDGKKRSESFKRQDKTSNDKSEKSSKPKNNGLSIAHSQQEEPKPTEEKASKDTPAPTPSPAPEAAQQADEAPAQDSAKPYDPVAALDEALKKSEAKESAASEQQVEAMADQISGEAPSPEDELSAQLSSVATEPQPAETSSILEQLQTEATQPEISEKKSAVDQDDTQEPSFGGVLNATTEQAAQDKRAVEGSNRNKTILSHGGGQYLGNEQPTFDSPINGANDTGEQPSVDPFRDINTAKSNAFVEPLSPPMPTGTLADIDQQNRAGSAPYATNDQPADQGSAAADAVNAVINAAPDPAPFDPLAAIAEAQPSPTPPMPNFDQQFGAPGAPDTPPPPPMPDFSQLPPLPPPPVFTQPDTGTPQQPQMQPVLQQPQMPEFPQAPLPPEQLGEVLPQAPDLPPAQAAGPVDPKQFKIPGQQ